MCYSSGVIEVRKLVWDEINTAHIKRHDVTKDEVEQVCEGSFAVRETYGGRLMVIGATTSARLLAVVLHPKAEGMYYVVTARTADRKERRIYQAEIQKGGEQAA